MWKASPFGRCRPAAITLTSRLPPLSIERIDLVEQARADEHRALVALRSQRALPTPAAKTSTLKPGGTFIFATGSLSAAVGIGGGAIGASLAAPSVSGRP